MSDPLLKHEPATARFVVYSPTRGVYYCGAPVPTWSKEIPSTARQVVFPTYSRPAGERQIELLKADVPDAKLMQCYPSRGDGATVTDLNNAAVPV